MSDTTSSPTAEVAETSPGTSSVPCGERALLGRGPIRAAQAERSFKPEESAGLFVGVSSFFDVYGQPAADIHAVDFAADDAVDLAELFALKLNLIRPDKVRLALSGTPKKKSSRAALQQLLAAQAKQFEARYTTALAVLDDVTRLARAGGLLVISFATHGYSTGGRDYLLCQDSLLAQPQATSLCVQELLGRMQEAGATSAERRLVLIDACREFLKKSRGLKGDGQSDSLGKALAEARGTVVLTGTVPGGFSYDDSTSQNGVFTKSVCAGLLGAAECDERGFITPEKLSDYLNQTVANWVERNRPGNRQQSTGISKVLDGACAMMPLAVNGEKWTEWKRKQDLKSKPTAAQLAQALGRLDEELKERAPVLREELSEQCRRLSDPTEAEDARARIDEITQTTLKIPLDHYALEELPAPWDSRDAFPGGRPFTEEEHSFFFGRAALVRKLAQELAQTPILVISGRAGCGKTSLVQAGLLPELRARRPNLQYLRVTPGKNPLASLEAALRELDPSRPLLLFLDQLGSIGTPMTAHFAYPMEFSLSLQSLIGRSSAVFIVLAMEPELSSIVNSDIFSPMEPKTTQVYALEGRELQKAIESQLAFGHAKLNPPALSTRIVREVENERCRMALIQLTLDELHHRRHGDHLVEAEYDRLGGIPGVLAKVAEATYQECTDEQKALLKDIFLRLVRMEVNPDLDRHHPAPVEQFTRPLAITTYGREGVEVFVDPFIEQPATAELLRKLQARRLVLVEGDRVELTHQKLLAAWARFVAWRRDPQERPFLMQRQEIAQATSEWRKSQRLLHQGQQLDALVPLRRHRILSTDEQDYLEQCFELRARERRRGVDQQLKDLAHTGWGIIFSAVSPGSVGARQQEAIREALKPLTETRRAMVRDPTYYRELAGPDGYRPGETKNQFLARLGVTPGTVNPSELPYYLLLVGDPESIPFEFQYQLDIKYAVGRICFDTVEEYATYAKSVERAESGNVPRRTSCNLFGAQREGDPVSRMTAEALAKLSRRLEKEQHYFRIETLLGPSALKRNLVQMLGNGSPDFETVLGGNVQFPEEDNIGWLDPALEPALLIAAGRGMAFPSSDPRQEADQGALLCQEAFHESSGSGPIRPEHFFAGRDLDAAVSLVGLVALLWGDFTAGTPRVGNYGFLNGQPPQLLAEKPMLSNLAKRLLSHRGGGAQAVIGMGDRLSSAFLAGGEEVYKLCNFDALGSVILRLLDGFPVGAATDLLNQRYVDLTTELHTLLHSEQDQDAPEHVQRLFWLRLAAWEARNFIVIGDPATRIPMQNGTD